MILNNILKFIGVTAAVGVLLGVASVQAADGLFPSATELKAPAQAAKLPDFEFANLNGGTLKSSEMKGKVVVIRFWATW